MDASSPAPGGSPRERYRRELEQGVLLPDPAQETVVELLERIHRGLAAGAPADGGSGSGGFLGGLRRRWRAPAPAPVRGAYLWGGVGRGKTHLMNAFYESVPRERKLRVHFHRFMRGVHDELKQLAGQRDPLQTVGQRLAARARLLCFDEFHVSDIGDAMLLAGLLRALFARGVTLVATSNVAPRELYRDGLQRARFVPAIELLERHTEVVHVDGDTDFRLRALERAEIYHYPLDDAAELSLQRSFESLGPEDRLEGGGLELLGRTIPTVRRADGIVWFRFDDLCDGPRSAADYIEIARCYHTVFVSGVPVLGVGEDDRAQRLISLVDELYDRNVNLIVSAAAAPGALYRGVRKAFEFRRTASRLEEMQARRYLARKHLP